MEGPSAPRDRRTLTPAVLASALFAVACAVIAISFVTARGGLRMPIAGAEPSMGSPAPTLTGALPTAASTSGPSLGPRPSAPPASIPPPSPGPPSSGGPTVEPTAGATTPPWESVAPDDPLLALPPCPEHPACFMYLIQRGDRLSSLASRYRIPVTTVRALNPEIRDPGTIVVGQTLYLGRSPFLRLERCPGNEACWLYVIVPGDGLSTIASRFGLPVEAILDANPAITDPNAIFSGQTIKLPERA